VCLKEAAAQKIIIVWSSNHTFRRWCWGWAILRGMPDNSARYHSLTVARYRLWVQRLTLKQFILFAGVVNFAVAAVVGAVTSPFLGPFSWSGVAVLAVLITAFQAWWRQGALPQGNEHPAGQGDDLTRS
jgi:hypothetical protein